MLLSWNHEPDRAKCPSRWFPASLGLSLLQTAAPRRSTAVEMGAASRWSGCATATRTAWTSLTRSTAVSALGFCLFICPFLACVDQHTPASLPKQPSKGKILVPWSLPRKIIMEWCEDNGNVVNALDLHTFLPRMSSFIGWIWPSRWLSLLPRPLSAPVTLSKGMLSPEAGGLFYCK